MSLAILSKFTFAGGRGIACRMEMFKQKVSSQEVGRSLHVSHYSLGLFRSLYLSLLRRGGPQSVWEEAFSLQACSTSSLCRIVLTCLSVDLLG